MKCVARETRAMVDYPYDIWITKGEVYNLEPCGSHGDYVFIDDSGDKHYIDKYYLKKYFKILREE